MRIEEFESEKAWWNNREENDFAWKVPVQQIIDNHYNLDIKNPNIEDPTHIAPKELLARYKKITSELNKTQQQLETELMASLGGGQMNATAKLFSENFPTLAASQNGIRTLRELILQLAIQGKLDPQNPNDEPASILLEKIKNEKAKLVKAGEIRERKIPPIDMSAVPFDIPQSWSWATLNDITRDWGQKKPDKKFTYIDVTAIDKEHGTISDDYKVLKPNEAPSRARKIVKSGTVIYSTVRPYLLNIAVIDRDFDPEPIVSTAFGILHPLQGINNKFIYYYLRSKSFIDYVENEMTGIAYPAINDSKLYKGLLPIPPTIEQKRIVAKVDKLRALCDQLQERIEESRHQSEILTESIVYHLLAG